MSGAIRQALGISSFMRIESEHLSFDVEPAQLVDYLSIVPHFEHLLPADQISAFVATDSSCSFTVKGNIPISFSLVESHPTHLRFESGKTSPFRFSLVLQLEPTTTGCTGRFVFEADVNGFMKLLIEKPLLKLANEMAQRLQHELR
ncbi:MAG: hypothetical protein RLZZ301_980 [Bacteroidota bacterium]